MLTARQTDELSQIVIVANTAAYLGSRLRQHSIVGDLARNHSAPDLIGYAQEILAKHSENFSLAAAANVYAALVAATMRPGSEIIEAERRLGIPKVRWAPELMQLGKETPSANTQTVVFGGGALKVDVQSSPPDRKPIGRRPGEYVVEVR